MKRKLQQCAALCLALALAFCLALPAWAEEPTTLSIDANTKGTIRVTGIAEPTDTSVTVNVYRLMTVNFDTTNQQPEEPMYTWVDAVADWVRENYSNYIGDAGDNSVQEAFSRAPTETIAAFYDALAAAIRDSSTNLTMSPTKDGTVQNTGDCTIDGLDMGNYLVLIEGGMKVYRPSAVNLVPVWKKTSGADPTETWVLEPAAVTLKFSEPALTKTVSDTQVAIGDTVTYTLVADVPHFPDNARNKGYYISDVLPAGMTFGSITKVEGYIGGEPDTSAAGTQLAENNDYSNENDRPVSSSDTPDFVLNFTNLKDASGDRYTKIKVTYTATVNENITVKAAPNTDLTHNINNAYLDYNNDPYSTTATWKTKTATTTVYSYGIKVNKKDDKGDALPGAEFALSANSDGSNPIAFVGSGGSYRKAKTGDQNPVTALAVDSNGNLTLSGLDVDTYYLTETKAPGGYVKLATPQTIVITDNKTGAEGTQDSPKPNGLLEDKSTGTDGADGYYELDVINSKGFTLPSTGGMGTVLFTAIGIVLMGGGLVLLLLYLRRRNRAE